MHMPEELEPLPQTLIKREELRPFDDDRSHVIVVLGGGWMVIDPTPEALQVRDKIVEAVKETDARLVEFAKDLPPYYRQLLHEICIGKNDGRCFCGGCPMAHCG